MNRQILICRAGLEEGYSSLTKIFRSATSERGLTAVRSRSRKNNSQLFSNTLAPLRYPDGLRSNANSPPREFARRADSRASDCGNKNRSTHKEQTIFIGAGRGIRTPVAFGLTVFKTGSFRSRGFTVHPSASLILLLKRTKKELKWTVFGKNARKLCEKGKNPKKIQAKN